MAVEVVGGGQGSGGSYSKQGCIGVEQEWLLCAYLLPRVLEWYWSELITLKECLSSQSLFLAAWGGAVFQVGESFY